MSKTKESSLEDLMVAMDVVDTLRHRQGLVEHELNAEKRRERLIQKLRDIYQAQGIEVTEAILNEGVLALEEERFSYTPPPSSFSTFLAKIYVSRSRWLKPLFIIFAILLALAFANYYLNTYPKLQEREALPTKISQTLTRIKKTAKNPQVIEQAQNWGDRAKTALAADDIEQATVLYEDLKEVQSVLDLSYSIRIVSRPGELSGVWRIPEANSSARNYYLIVEAIDRKGNVLEVPIISEEDNSNSLVKKWGIRVSQSIFQQVSADKSDDGIIQNNKVGTKVEGELQAKYLVKTTGSAITQW
ncbi:MAG: DUF6384 family protein [Cellvibrionaceae bacterium]